MSMPNHRPLGGVIPSGTNSPPAEVKNIKILTKSVHVKWQPYIVTLNNLKKSFMIPMGEPGARNQEQFTEEGKGIGTSTFDIYIIMWSFPGNMPKYYPGNMPKYYSTKYHYRNLHEV